jgi:hypothetical protein
MPGKELPEPFRVRVSRGENPVEGAKVSFMIMEGQGVLNPTGFVLTGKDGIAQCAFKFADSLDIQCIRVRAELIDVIYPDTTGTDSHPSIIFNANASVAKEVFCVPPTECSQLKDVRTVQDAIDGLCKTISERTSRIVWVHGNSLQVEKMAGDISVVRENYATAVRMTSGSKAGMHFSIPINQSPGSILPVAQESLVRLRASSDSAAAFSLSIAVSIYDGEITISDNNKIGISGTWETKEIDFPDKKVNTGIGISIYAECTAGSGKIELSAAGCRILSDW